MPAPPSSAPSPSTPPAPELPALYKEVTEWPRTLCGLRRHQTLSKTPWQRPRHSGRTARECSKRKRHPSGLLNAYAAASATDICTARRRCETSNSSPTLHKWKIFGLSCGGKTPELEPDTGECAAARTTTSVGAAQWVTLVLLPYGSGFRRRRKPADHTCGLRRPKNGVRVCTPFRPAALALRNEANPAAGFFVLSRMSAFTHPGPQQDAPASDVEHLTSQQTLSRGGVLHPRTRRILPQLWITNIIRTIPLNGPEILDRLRRTRSEQYLLRHPRIHGRGLVLNPTQLCPAPRSGLTWARCMRC